MNWGIKFMANDKSLISFSMISTSWEKYKKDNIDLIVPFVLYYFENSDSIKINDIVSIFDAKKYIETEFGLKILSNIMEIIFNRLSLNSYGYLKKVKRNFYLINKSYNIVDFKLSRKKNASAQNIVLKTFYNFLNNQKINFQKSDAKNFLISYLCNYGKDVIAENEVMIEKNDFWNYKVGEFIQFLAEYDPETYEFVKDMAKGGMISSVIFGSSNSYHTDKLFRNTEIYYDTPLLMHILGYSGEALQKSIKELTNLLQKQNAKICYFRHNLEELEGILNAYTNLYNQDKLSNAYNFDYFISKKIKPETISEYIALLEKNLSVLGLTLKDTPNYINTKGNIDWDKFDSYLQSNIPYNNPDRRKNDIESLASIYRLRKNTKYTEYETCRALFVTSNKSLAYHAKHYFKYDESRSGIPAIIDDTFLTALMWLKNDNKNESLPNLKIISDALASQSLSTDFWNSFIEKVQKYEDENIITSDEAVRLKVDIFTKKNIYDVTNGDIDKLDHSSMLEILQRNEIQKQQELLQQKSELLKENEEKDDTILELYNKLIDSRVQYYLNQKIVLWKFLIIVGKSWLFILCAFLVLLTKVFDYLLSISSSLFVNLSIGLSVTSSILLKFIDKKLSSYNKGIEIFFYKKAFKNIKNIINCSEEEYNVEIIKIVKSEVKEFKLLSD